MSAQDDRAGPAFQDLRDLLHDPHHLGLRLGRADGEHAEIKFVGQADQRAFVGRPHLDPRRRLRMGFAAHFVRKSSCSCAASEWAAAGARFSRRLRRRCGCGGGAAAGARRSGAGARRFGCRGAGDSAPRAAARRRGGSGRRRWTAVPAERLERIAEAARSTASVCRRRAPAGRPFQAWKRPHCRPPPRRLSPPRSALPGWWTRQLPGNPIETGVGIAEQSAFGK